MNIYDSNGYLDMARILGGSADIIVILGARGTGKTYGALKYMLDTDSRFILMRRTQTQIDMVAKPKIIPLDTRIAFNDICMREMKLDITDDGILYDMDTESILQYKERFIKYREDENTLIYQNEIELDLLRDPRLMEILANIYLQKYSARTGTNLTSV